MKNEGTYDGGFKKICGILTDLKCKRDEASFVFSDRNKTAAGVVAMAAGFVGTLNETATTATSGMVEEADYIEFTLQGCAVKGWMWRSPFNNGDEVEVIAEWQHDHFEAYAVARPADRIVALYPHCSRGRKPHWSNALKWWFIAASFIVLLTMVMFSLVQLFNAESWAEARTSLTTFFIELIVFAYPVFLVMTFFLARRWMSFVRFSEKIFKEFGWEEPNKIDLKKSSKDQRQVDDPSQCGVFYFRY